MKLMGAISDSGMRLLERSFVPCMKKFGNDCYLLINPSELCFVLDTQQTDGLQTWARLENSLVFSNDTLICTSMEDNHIAFKLQLDHLLNVLHAASAEKAESMIMKLVVRNVYGHSSGEISGSRAMLTFTWRRSDMEMEQEIPVGAPCRGNSLASLCTLCDPSSPCPFYIDFLPVLSELTIQSFVVKCKELGEFGTLSINQQGNLHLSTNQMNVLLGIVFSGLPESIPESAGENTESLRSESIEASEAGNESSAVLSLKHWIRVLQSCQLSHPERVLCGIYADDGIPLFVHVIFVYPGEVGNSRNLFCKVSVREE